MQHTPVKSSNVASVGYDPASDTLEVQFHSGRLYRYEGVTPEVHRKIIGADSVGRAVHAELTVKGNKGKEIGRVGRSAGLNSVRT